MKIVWNNPYFVLEKPLGYKPCGLKRNNTRPDEVLFTVAETNEIYETKWDYFLRQLMHITKRSVSECLT